MVVLNTPEAEAVMAGASHGGDDSTKVALLDTAVNSILAIGRRTPFEVVPVLDVGPCQ